MSSMLHYPIRARWAARSVVLKKWVANGGFRPGDPVCELEVEGVAEVFHDRALAAGDTASIRFHYTNVGHELNAWGALLEYSDAMGWDGKPHDAALHRSGRRKLLRRARYPRIFLNYRRDDADASAGRLHETLVRTFGKDEVFMDQFSIRPGEVFSWTIQQAVAHADVLISLIGPRWWALKDAHDKPRISSQWDYVRRELVAALDRGTVVLPVLVNGAPLPDSTFHRWDEEFYGLEDLQFHQLTGRHWEAEVEELLAAVAENLSLIDQERKESRPAPEAAPAESA